jgi:hypothetical protein
MKFVQTLSRKFPAQLSSLLNDFVQNLLADYQQNRQTDWAKKSAVLNLIITASISQYTYRNGAVEINISFDELGNYLQTLVLSEMGPEENIDNLPILKATCLKFIYMFRNQIPD